MSDIFPEESAELEAIEIEQDRNLAKLFYAYRNLMKTDDGKLVIMDILNKCGAFKTPYNAVQSGRHSVAMYILGMVDIPGFEPINMKETK